VTEPVPVMVEFAAETEPLVKVTVPVTEPKPAGVAILSVLSCAIVDAIVPVATPEAFVVEPGWDKVFPVPVAAKAAEAPLTGLLLASRRVIVTVDVVVPSAVTPVDGEAEIVEFATTGVPATKTTVPVAPVSPAGPVMLRVFDSATVVLIVPVATPEAFVTEAGCTSVFPVPVDPKVAVAPLTGLLFESRRVIVTVDVVVPSAVTPLEGEAEIVEFATTGVPAPKVTVPVTPVNPAGALMLKVLVSAIVDLIVPVACPEAFVFPEGWVSVFPVPVAAKLVATPLTGFP